MRPSTIREILKATIQPDIISFAGGLPAPELFPVEQVREACNRVLQREGSAALQYGTTEGYNPLREWIVLEMARRGISCQIEDLLLTNGSQQALDLIGRVLINPGDVVLTENPTYLAAIQAFRMQETAFITVPMDEYGIIPEALPALIKRHQPKLLYTIPNFQNPTGITQSLERRQTLHDIAVRYGLLLVEDDPYGELRYTGENIPPVKALDGDEAQVIYCSTFSKIIAPGMRMGWVVAPPEILSRLIIAKQTCDLHTSSLDQRVVYEYLACNDVRQHVAKIRAAYGQRYAVMDEAMSASMPEGFSWTHPEGGMFLWVTCPSTVDTGLLLQAALGHRVVFVPGQDFFPDGSGRNFMRLSFSNSTPDKIREGIARLSTLCKEALETETAPPEVQLPI